MRRCSVVALVTAGVGCGGGGADVPDGGDGGDGADGGGDPCDPAVLGRSYVGCDYWPTITGNMVSSRYEFAVAVSNTGGAAATVTVEGGALAQPLTFAVGPGAVEVRTLPWVAALKLCDQPSWMDCNGANHGQSARADGGAYHVRASLPVTVYQFNPLDYTRPGLAENSYSNDASLLFPSNAWGDDHYVVTWREHGGVHPSLMAVTAAEDGTAVTITTRASTVAEGGAPAFTAGEPQTVMLDRGDVLELGSIAAGADLTGSRVTSDQPVQVIGAHFCAQVPDDVAFCDHLEESMFPVATLSNRYIINAAAVPVRPGGREQVVRIVATRPGTTLSYDPPQPRAPSTLAAAGDHVDIVRQAASYMITASQKVLVAQLMEGRFAITKGNDGDPDLTLAVPVEQYRTSYLFHAPTNYTVNYLDITAPVGAEVVLDTVALSTVATFTPIGTTGFAVARVTLSSGPAGDGNHFIHSQEPFGILVYGYGQDTSYSYPGGLDLDLLPIL